MFVFDGIKDLRFLISEHCRQSRTRLWSDMFITSGWWSTVRKHAHRQRNYQWLENVTGWRSPNYTNFDNRMFSWTSGRIRGPSPANADTRNINCKLVVEGGTCLRTESRKKCNFYVGVVLERLVPNLWRKLSVSQFLTRL